MRVAAIVPAAGKGRRIKSNIDKPYIALCGKPILAHTLLKLSASKRIDEIVIAVNKDRINTLKRSVIDKFRIKKIRIVTGGLERMDSVYNALKEISRDIDYVLINYIHKYYNSSWNIILHHNTQTKTISLEKNEEGIISDNNDMKDKKLTNMMKSGTVTITFSFRPCPSISLVEYQRDNPVRSSQ